MMGLNHQVNETPVSGLVESGLLNKSHHGLLSKNQGCIFC